MKTIINVKDLHETSSAFVEFKTYERDVDVGRERVLLETIPMPHD